MKNITMFDDARSKKQDLGELICVHCAYRWYMEFGTFAQLEKEECPNCGKIGGVITTGQVIPAEEGSGFTEGG